MHPRPSFTRDSASIAYYQLSVVNPDPVSYENIPRRMDYVPRSQTSYSRSFFHFASVRRFNLFELVLVTLITLTIYSVVLVCVGTNSSLFCSMGHGTATVSYINFKDYSASSCEAKIRARNDESTRILTSVKSELSKASKKMKQVHLDTDNLNRQIPEKQQKIAQLDEEIASAQRRFDELKETKNARVFLPRVPLFNKSPDLFLPPNITNPDRALDFSRCSITSFMPIYLEEVTNSDTSVSLLYQELKKKANLVDSKEKACLVVRVTGGEAHDTIQRNQVVISTKTGAASSRAVLFHPGRSQSYFGSSLHLELPPPNPEQWKSFPPLLPYKREDIFLLLLENEGLFDTKALDEDILRLQGSATNSGDRMKVVRCGQKASRGECTDKEARAQAMKNSIFCVLVPSDSFQETFWQSLKTGCVPVILSLDHSLPFQELIDWRMASIRVHPSRLPELHFILRSFEPTDLVEMKRMGRNFFEKYLADTSVVTTTILSYLHHRLGIPLPPQPRAKAQPLFEESFVAKVLSPATVIIASDDEYLGPMEARVPSEAYRHNLSIFGIYSQNAWSGLGDVSRCPEYLPTEVELPAEAEFYEETHTGYRPIQPGSGDEFSRALGGNRMREQFTIVLITYNRDAVLVSHLERLHKLPYLNKILVIWNNVGREPVGAWPKLHVPIEFIKVDQNSLNNRFIPWDRIETEAILSLDDDIDLKQHEIIFAFRVWRENRDRLVGFPARYHARFGEEMYYNSNHTCQYSIILTGAAFLHKAYFHEYTSRMSVAIREHVDKVMNCEDIAMNFLISHLTRKPPLKTTSKWTIKCPTCTEMLSQDESHFQERHECIRLFTQIYGYNPLKFTQFRADSVLFKTRLPADKQKCFKYV